MPLLYVIWSMFRLSSTRTYVPHLVFLRSFLHNGSVKPAIFLHTRAAARSWENDTVAPTRSGKSGFGFRRMRLLFPLAEFPVSEHVSGSKLQRVFDQSRRRAGALILLGMPSRKEGVYPGSDGLVLFRLRARPKEGEGSEVCQERRRRIPA